MSASRRWKRRRCLKELLHLGLLVACWREADGQDNATMSFPSTNEPLNFTEAQDTKQPMASETKQPTVSPSFSPSDIPTYEPSNLRTPSHTPSFWPSIYPTDSKAPSNLPSPNPSSHPSPEPSDWPSDIPTVSSRPSESAHPSLAPSLSSQPSSGPSGAPSSTPTISVHPSNTPTSAPSSMPTVSSRPTFSSAPSSLPSSSPSIAPTAAPSLSPSPSVWPTVPPSSAPSDVPSVLPTQQRFVVNETLLVMTFAGLHEIDNTLEWANITDEHVSKYWNTFPSLGNVIVFDVTTKFRRQGGRNYDGSECVPTLRPTMSVAPTSIPSASPQPSYIPTLAPTTLLPTSMPSTLLPTSRPTTTLQPTDSTIFVPSLQPSLSYISASSSLPSSLQSSNQVSNQSVSYDPFADFINATNSANSTISLNGTHSTDIPIFLNNTNSTNLTLILNSTLEILSSLPFGAVGAFWTTRPSLRPSSTPSDFPSNFPSPFPSDSPSTTPSMVPSSSPSSIPSLSPSEMPSFPPSDTRNPPDPCPLLAITYEQRITYGLFSEDPPDDLERDLFVLPFVMDQQDYIEKVINITNTQNPVSLFYEFHQSPIQILSTTWPSAVPSQAPSTSYPTNQPSQAPMLPTLPPNFDSASLSQNAAITILAVLVSLLFVIILGAVIYFSRKDQRILMARNPYVEGVEEIYFPQEANEDAPNQIRAHSRHQSDASAVRAGTSVSSANSAVSAISSIRTGGQVTPPQRNDTQKYPEQVQKPTPVPSTTSSSPVPPTPTSIEILNTPVQTPPRRNPGTGPTRPRSHQRAYTDGFQRRAVSNDGDAIGTHSERNSASTSRRNRVRPHDRARSLDDLPYAYSSPTDNEIRPTRLGNMSSGPPTELSASGNTTTGTGDAAEYVTDIESSSDGSLADEFA